MLCAHESARQAPTLPPMPDTASWPEANTRQSTLGLRLTWDKRYITLGPVATISVCRFALPSIGDHCSAIRRISVSTCALTRRSHPASTWSTTHAVVRGVPERTELGKDVFVPVDWVIGRRVPLSEGVWRMLTESLAVGRSISLLSLSLRHGENGDAANRAATPCGPGAQSSSCRSKIGRHRGNPCAGSWRSLFDGRTRVMTGALSTGRKRAVCPRPPTYDVTERGRLCSARDRRHGYRRRQGYCMRPRTFLGAAYMQIPVSITVQGANILTRSRLFRPGWIAVIRMCSRRSWRRTVPRSSRVRRVRRGAVRTYTLSCCQTSPGRS